MMRRWIERVRPPRPRVGAFVVPLLLTVVLAYAAYLRLDALFAVYGPFSEPGWVVSLEKSVRGTREFLAPPSWTWTKAGQPYVGGDPINYIGFARSMRHFYQAHVREPVFLAVTRAFLFLTGGQDVAVSFASATFSVLAVFGTFLLGRALASRWVGLAAAAALAVEREIVAWAPEGWRDDAFTAMVCFGAWALLRFEQQRTWPTAVLAGLVAGAACLTRITAASFLLPAFVILAVSRTPEWRKHLAQAVLAVAIMTTIVAPYLINCYREFGDPLYSINSHTRFYRSRAGAPFDQPQSALGYTSDQLRSRPIASTDTALRGLVVYPFAIKWAGFEAWMPRLGQILSWLAAAGLFMWLWTSAGRFVLAMLVLSLVPYMLTWAVAGGGEWRFTMHAYPFYLVAAFDFVRWIVGGVRDLWSRRLGGIGNYRVLWKPAAVRAAVLAGLLGVAWLERFWSPALIARETLEAGEAATIAADRYDAVFFRDGWSDLITTGAVSARFAVTTQATLYVPFPETRPIRLVFRLDPVPRGDVPQQRVKLFLDRQPIAVFNLSWNPVHVGAYTVDIPAGRMSGRLARLVFVADSVHAAGEAAALYPGLAPSQPVAFRLWYVRVMPL